MINRECIYKIIKGYLPTAEEDLLVHLTAQAEKHIELSGKDIIRKLVLRELGQASKIDTKV